MPKDNFTPRSTFTKQQVLAANGDLEEAISNLEKATIGSHYNPRQRDILLVAYENYEAEKEGRDVVQMQLGEYEENVAKHFGVDPQTIKNDIKLTGSLMEKIPMGESKQKKVHWMSDEGAKKYRAFEQGKAALILEAAEKIKAADEAPSGWQRLIIPILAVFTMLLTALNPVEAHANGSILSEYLMGSDETYTTMYAAGKPEYNAAVMRYVWSDNSSEMGATMGMAASPELGGIPINRLPLLEVMDRSSFFDEHRPKMLYEQY